MNKKSTLRSTNVNSVFLNEGVRYKGGKVVPCLGFTVKLLTKDVYISINKNGLRKAWKRALISASSSEGRLRRRDVVRWIPRPPVIDI